MTEMFVLVAAVDESLLAELTEMTPVNLEFTPGGYKDLIHLIYRKWPQKKQQTCSDNFSCVQTTSRINDRSDISKAGLTTVTSSLSSTRKCNFCQF